MATKVYAFDEDGFKRVQEATRRVLGQPRVGSQRTLKQPVIGGIELRWVELDEELSAASNAKTAPETADAHFLVIDQSDGELSDGSAMTMTNRSESTTFPDGYVGIAARIMGEWHFIAGDCP